MFNRNLVLRITLPRKNPFTYVTDGIRCLDSHVTFIWACEIPRSTPSGDIVTLLKQGQAFLDEQVRQYQAREEVVPANK